MAQTMAAAVAEVAITRSNGPLPIRRSGAASFSSMDSFMRCNSSGVGGSLFRNTSVSRTAPRGFENASASTP